MAKQRILSLKYLEGIKPGQPMPGMEEMREWLIGLGFTKQNDNVCLPNHIIPNYPPIYLPSQYDTINHKTLRAVINALEEIEAIRAAADQRPGIEISDEAKSLIEDHPEFLYRMDGEMLQVYARDFPEFGFTVPYKGDERAIINTLEGLLKYYGSESNFSLAQYYKCLNDALEYGLQREVIDRRPVLVSLVDASENIPLVGHPNELIKVVKERSQWNSRIVSDQLDAIDELENFGFAKAEFNANTQRLTLAHPAMDHEISLPAHGELGYLTRSDWEQFLSIRREAMMAQKARLPHLPTRKMQVPPPLPDDTLLIFDAGALFNLAVARGNEPEKTWFDLLNMTKKLPGIGKIIIPDYIADVEMRNKAAVYNSDGELEFVNLPATRKEPPESFKELMRHAVRRHVNEHGEVEYLAEPGAEGNGGKIIIWETTPGREEAVRMANARAANTPYYRTPDFGEKQISHLIANELEWKNPVNVITTDLNYMYKQNPPAKTLSGGLVSYDSAYAYMEGEFLARGEEIKAQLRLPHADCESHYRTIAETLGFYNQNLLQEHIGGHSDAEGIIAVIANAVQKKNQPQTTGRHEKLMLQTVAATAGEVLPVTATAPMPQSLPATPEIPEPVAAPTEPVVFAHVETTSLGNLLKKNLQHEPAYTATRVKDILTTPHTRLMKKTVERALRGSDGHPPRSDLLYTMLEKMDALSIEQGITQAPSERILSITPPTTENIAVAVMQELASLAPAGTNPEEFTATFLQTLVREMNDVSLHNSERIGTRTIEHILNDEIVPTPRVAAALRDLLRRTNPDAVQEYDRSYFATRAKVSRAASDTQRQ